MTNLITKPKILGFGLNLQICTRQIFSGIKDSYEEFYQAVKRSNRVGSTKPLDVHIPVTELEVPFVENVLRKADRVEADTLFVPRTKAATAYGLSATQAAESPMATPSMVWRLRQPSGSGGQNTSGWAGAAGCEAGSPR